jgi:hypothetical protein
MVVRIRVLAVVLGLASLGLAGCGSALSLFDPSFLADLGAGQQIASVPGDAPTLLVTVENETSHPVLASLSYRTQSTGVELIQYQVESGRTSSQALICPVEEITLGDVADPKAVGALVLLTGTAGFNAAAPYVEVEPFGVVMKKDINYDCGDAITFAVVPSSATRSGYQIFAYIERSGRGNP